MNGDWCYWLNELVAAAQRIGFDNGNTRISLYSTAMTVIAVLGVILFGRLAPTRS